MLRISKPLGTAQVASYYSKEYSSADQKSYYAKSAALTGQWHGQLAAQMGLVGDVDGTHFHRLAEGTHPHDPEMVLLRKTTAKTYVNEHGETVTTMARRAAWDATISAPKSVSLAALVGGDERVLEAHRASVTAALNELERYTDARLGGAKAPERTGKWICATFEHDTARPVDGYSAPQLHTHAVVMNVTESSRGKLRSIQSRELYKSQQLITKMYRAELAIRLKALGYQVERGKSREPQIVGFTEDYLKASSLRREQILQDLAKHGYSGATAAEIAAQRTKSAKGTDTPEEIRRQHMKLAASHGNQPALVVSAALARTRGFRPYDDEATSAKDAVDYARTKASALESVPTERTVEIYALDRGMGFTTLGPIRQEIARQIERGEFLERPQMDTSGRAFTTPKTVQVEQELIEAMRAGQHKYQPIGGTVQWMHRDPNYAKLMPDQRHAVDTILASRDQFTALDGIAGSGKTYALSVVRTTADSRGYAVRGLAPTSTAAANLAGAGMPTTTVQLHLQRAEVKDRPATLYVLDEASLASSDMMQRFFATVRPQDRVLLVGDTRQHQAIEAGKPFEFLQDHGMHTAKLTTIIRQTDLDYRRAIQLMADGHVRDGLEVIDGMGKMHGIPKREERLAKVVDEFMKDQHHTLVVAPENQSRIEINDAIHAALHASRPVDATHIETTIYADRKELTGPDRAYADRYDVGDILRYNKGSQALGLEKGEYVTVVATERTTNQITVENEDGKRIKYDPARLRGVSVYAEETRVFAPGDKVRLTAKHHELRIDNRTRGTLLALDDGEATVQLDGRSQPVTFNLNDHPHLDYGYTSTSYSIQSETEVRVIEYVDNGRSHDAIVNQRLAYTAGARGVQELIIITDDKARAYANLERDVSERVAILPERPGFHNSLSA